MREELKDFFFVCTHRKVDPQTPKKLAAPVSRPKPKELYLVPPSRTLKPIANKIKGVPSKTAGRAIIHAGVQLFSTPF